ncbi:MAG TPA: cobalamin-dependent protein [Chloroflexota bacterium]|nr:cobalamin-dependent protein [Chloroflexota bacterium]
MLILYNPRAAVSKARIPMSLMALAALLEGKRAYEIVDGNLDPDPQRTIAEIVEAGQGPHYLLCTVMPGPQMAWAVPHCRALKARFPALTVVWGGYFPSMHPEVCLNSGYVDFIVQGQGEHTLLELLDVVERGGGLSTVLGIWYRDGITLRHTPPRPLADPNTMPRFPYHRLPMERYLGHTFMGHRTVCHHSSVSCPFPCSFCAVIRVFGRAWLAETPERMHGTLRHLQDTYGVDAVEFYDNNFFTQEARTLEFAQRIAGMGLSWWGEGRVDTLLKYSDRTWEGMRASGLKSVFMGAESGSQEALKQMRKDPLKIHDTLAIAQRCQQYGVIPEFSFVLGNPRNPHQDIVDSIAFIRRLKQVSPLCEVSLYLYTPMPGGDLYDEAVAQGFAYPTTLDEWITERWLRFSGMRDPATPWLTTADVGLVRDFETVLNAHFPSYTDIKLTRLQRALLRTISTPRYRFQIYRKPLELRAALARVHYRHPQVEGF